jgi:hypothetical protein
MSSFKGWTKSDLEDEVETLRAKLEDAHSIIAEALGYGELEDDDSAEIEDDDSEEYEDDDAS